MDQPSALALLLYIDPGSGSLLLQLLISVALGSWLVFRKKLAALFRMIAGRRGEAREAGVPSHAEAPEPAGESRSAHGDEGHRLEE